MQDLQFTTEKQHKKVRDLTSSLASMLVANEALGDHFAENDTMPDGSKAQIKAAQGVIKKRDEILAAVEGNLDIVEQWLDAQDNA